ncbi:EVI5-like protein isoform X2 [Lingula anatina]|uniref:EVI5-like protein isoform X2 n=1 Tax=Lingula anatina TaxID=7574 RepID=A0A2R2MQI6_LINAN|nr:EVI5-like protein isoform X2 [Lingula anatina]|eukprot:XP_023932514.1 EVI5-like protein isoform X2 [Lingula anatina]
MTAANGEAPVDMMASATPEDLALLAKLEEANRQFEQDTKSLISTTSRGSVSGHSRKGSDISSNSITSTLSNLTLDDQSSPQDEYAVWGKVIGDWETYAKKKTYIRDLVRKGIPHHFRGLAWQHVCNAHDSENKELYAEYLKKTSPCEKLIKRDIARTYPEHSLFKDKDGLGQESLFNVMKAYSIVDREVGYCQGSCFIVGLLLMLMPEEEAFAVLVKLMKEYRLRELFKPSMTELGLCMFQLECMVQDQLPSLYMHFQSQSFHTSMYASHWFLTLFTTALPLEMSFRVMDLYISEGMEIIFKIGIAILQDCQIELMTCDMEGMLKFFQKDMPAKYEQDYERLLSIAYDVKYNARKMKKLEKEYTTLKAKENEEQIELRRLRTENRLLRQRIDNLEKETATLADRLIHNQVTKAQEAEEMFILKRDMSGMRTQNEELKKQLEEAQNTIKQLQKERTSSVTSTTSVDSEQEEVIKQLQSELVTVRLKAADQSCNVKEMVDKIRELENTNRRLQTEPESEIASIQEELIAVKLREAEGRLAVKELRQQIKYLTDYWDKYWEKVNASPKTKEKNSKAVVQNLQDELMGVKLREAESLADVKEMKARVMELETQNQICSHQIRRMDEENKKLKDKIEAMGEKEKELRNEILALERKSADSESRVREESMMTRIKNAEHSTTIAEMRQKIAELEIQNQELVTAGQLQSKGETQDLENRIADLQDEVLQLRMSKIKNMHLPATHPFGSESGDSDAEEEAVSGNLNLHSKLTGTDSNSSEGMNGLRMELAGDLITPLPSNHNNNDIGIKGSISQNGAIISNDQSGSRHLNGKHETNFEQSGSNTANSKVLGNGTNSSGPNAQSNMAALEGDQESVGAV